MVNLSLKNRLQYHGDTLSKSEKIIADYVIMNPTVATSSTITDLAKKIGTSKSTITRFCQKLGYRNYVEFQTLFAAEFDPKQTPSEICQRINSYYNQILAATIEMLHLDELMDFVKQILNANQILICGIGSSGLTANEFSIRLEQMGILSRAITDSHLMMMKSSMFSSKDLVIAISNSGKTLEVIKACEIAKQVGTPVYAITQKNQSSLTKVSDKRILISGTSQINDNKFINSQLPILFLIDIVTYLLMEDPNLNDKYHKTAQALLER